MADIQSTAAEIRRGKKRRRWKIEEDRKKLQGKNIMAPLLHRAAIIIIIKLYIHLTVLQHFVTVICRIFCVCS